MARRETQTPSFAAPPEAETGYRPPYRWALAVFAGVLALYAATLAPSTAFWDTSEYIATAHILGTPHPPGNPLFVILGRTWELLLYPLPLAAAVKINLFSATMSAAAAAFWFLVAHRVLAFFDRQETFRLVGAGAATLLSATVFTVWNQSVVNEKVYTVSLFTTALLTFLIFRWRDNLGRGKDDNLLILVVFILALSIGNHLMGLLAGPALLVYVLLVRPATIRNVPLYAFALLFGAVGLLVQLVLPLRAAEDPVINEGDPKCESVVDATVTILTFGRWEKCAPLAESLQRRQYNKPPITLDPTRARLEMGPGGELRWGGPGRGPEMLAGQIAMYLQYFNWQWARGLGGGERVGGAPVSGAPLRPVVSLLFALLIGYGARRHYQRDRTSWWYFITLFATVTVGLILYLNFKHGYTLRPNLPGDSHEVRERDYFYLISFSFSGLWAGIGVAALWRDLAERWSTGGDASRRPLAHAVLALALVPLVLNASRASRAGDYAARDWAFNLLNSVEPYGVLFTNGDNDTFPLWYLQEVEGLRRDVIVIVYSYLATEWYPRQLRDLSRPCEPEQDPLATPTVIVCQRPFVPEAAVLALSDRPWLAPTRAILGWTNEEIAFLFRSEYQAQLLRRGARRFTAGELETVIPENVRLIVNDLFVLGIIQHAIGDRPIYFASTTDAYRPLGLDPYLIRQGLAYRVHNGPIAEDSANLARIPGAITRSDVQWMDLEYTETVLWDQFVFHNLFEREFWSDHSTNGIPAQYYRAHWDLAAAYALRGDEEAVTRNLSRAEQFLSLAFGRLPARPAVPEPAPTEAPAETARP
ncbi:MAG: glycosyltransferase family 117 protein [Gemmatimonadota bacterium]